MIRVVVFLLVFFCNSAFGQSKLFFGSESEVKAYSIKHKWKIKTPLHTENEGQNSITYLHDRITSIYFFSKKTGRCQAAMNAYEVLKEYQECKKELNITSTDKPFVLPGAAKTLTCFGMTINGIDFFWGYDDTNKIIIRGIGRHGY